jgi:hypothetical protein
VRRGISERRDDLSTHSSRSFSFGVNGLLSRVKVIRKNLRQSKGSTELSSTQLNELEQLRRENNLLREAVNKLEIENDKLHQDFANRIVIETFEGEGKLRKARQEASVVDAEISVDDLVFYDDPSTQWCDELEEGACPVEPTISFSEALRDRAYW